MAARGATTPHPAVSASRAAALARLLHRSVPARNLYLLADQLKLRPPRAIPHVIRRVSPNYPVGHQDTFWVLSEDQNRNFQMRATIVYETPHLYVYVQNGTHVNLAAIRKSANKFERSTYPTDRRHFGSEWRPGVDGDPHLSCLLGNLRSSSAAGFYSAEDEYPRLVNPYSNQREMFYINALYMSPGTGDFDSTLAHEFQHMIHWHMHPHDNAWLNEGMSMLAEQINGYPPLDKADSFLSQPDTQLDSWSLTDNVDAYYGGAFLYLLYLYDRFGSGFIRDVVADSRYTDFEVIGDVLRKHHIHQTADQVFAQWVIANYLDDPSVAHGIYSYRNMSHTIATEKKTSAPFSLSGKLPPYAAQYTVITPPAGSKPFHLQFSAPTLDRAVDTAGADASWWSNKGDMSDMRLTRTLDLRHVHRASLHFKAWYDIEKDYDYAYVEASTDGGKTWSTLPGTHTTRSNPNGGNYGNGYTGQSKGWQQETVDLSRYAGKRIELRFQYITDDEYNGQGMVMKDLGVPAVGFRDNLSGWQAQGFVPLDSNAIPAAWTVQLISYTAKGITVSRLPLSGGHGSVLIDPGQQGLKKLVVVPFFAAPRTTTPLSYQLSATSS